MTDNKVTTERSLSDLNLIMMQGISLAIVDWLKDAEALNLADNKAKDENFWLANDTLTYLINVVPDYTLYWTKSSRHAVAQLRLGRNADLKKLILKITFRFWKAVREQWDDKEIIDLFIRDSISVTYPVGVYTTAENSSELEVANYLASMSVYSGIEEEMANQCKALPELIPLFYFTLFINQIMEEIAS